MPKQENKEKLKIAKGQSEAVSQRRTDNTMTKIKKDKRTKNDIQNTIQKTKNQTTRTPLKTGDELMCSGTVNSYCFTRRTNNWVWSSMSEGGNLNFNTPCQC